jgi:hypothetical protein
MPQFVDRVFSGSAEFFRKIVTDDATLSAYQHPVDKCGSRAQPECVANTT